MADSRLLPVPEGLAGLRLDVAISRMFGLSRTAAAGLIDEGAVSLDGAAPSRSERVAAGAWLEISIPEPVDLAAAPPIAVDGLVVLYQDDELVVVDKPVGVAAHPSIGWTGPTVVQGLAAMGLRLSTSGAAERQGIVHRLDAGTTGAMVVAKSERAYTELKRAFKERTVTKLYSALVQGHPDPSSGTIDAPIDRHPSSDWKFAVVAGGRPSVTHYETAQAYRAASLLDVRLETGRTHQIRVHMAALRHPCCGDQLYGADPVLSRRLGLSRQWLHARSLGFEHPATGQWLVIESPFPADLQHALDVLEAES
ncbi:MAG: RluA family pseudouridine synthase [Jatrophihabitantaceae bacterium]